MYPPEENLRSGYLQQNFRLFHLKDKKEQQFDFHYHDFDKIVIFLSGKVTYIVEGKSYHLKPWDILLVPHHDIHKPVIDGSSVYERIVIWVKMNLWKNSTARTVTSPPVFRKVLTAALT